MKNTNFPEKMDFNSLRDFTLEDIKQYSQASWTDHGVSDPGITILEQLVAKFAQIAEKLQLDIPSLLASRGDISLPMPVRVTPESADDNFFTANEVLTCAPITATDLRRVLLDHEQVRNGWIEPVGLLESPMYWNSSLSKLDYEADEYTQPIHITGRYRALVELEPDLELTMDEKELLRRELTLTLSGYRNLCEELVEIILLEPEYIKINGGIEVKPGTDVELLLTNIHLAIEEYINPTLVVESKVELKDKGLSIDRIYQGPRLDTGYYSDSLLDTVTVRRDIRVSDLLRIILDFDEVNQVKGIAISNFTDPQDDDWRKWVLPISSGRVPRLDAIYEMDEVTNITTSFIDCYKDDSLCVIDNERVDALLSTRKIEQDQMLEDKVWYDLPIPSGVKVDLSYESVQQIFPAVYGVGDNELPVVVGESRLAQVKQLQAFLLLFDQLLANYTQQVAMTGELLSMKTRSHVQLDDVDSNVYIPRTYQAAEFSCQGDSVVMVGDYWQSMKDILEPVLNEAEHDWGAINNLKHEDRLLTHLFARLGEQFTDHDLLKRSLNATGFQQYLNDKHRCLNELADLAHDRYQGQNYNQDDVKSGFERRLRAKLAVEEEAEELHVIEHMLLYSETEIPDVHHDGVLLTQLRNDGNYYTVLESNDHQLIEGEIISVFQHSEYEGNYSVNIVDTNQVDIALDLGIDLDSAADRDKTFTVKWQRGITYKNPYAMQVSVVLPREQGRFQDAEFRNLVARIARAEMPAHIQLHLRWLDESNWNEFTSHIADWKATYQGYLVGDEAITRETLDGKSNAVMAGLL